MKVSKSVARILGENDGDGNHLIHVGPPHDDSVELDWADENGFAPEEALANAVKFASRFNLKAEMVNPSGPGGGWPIIRFSGDSNDIDRLLLQYCGGDKEQANFLHYGE